MKTTSKNRPTVSFVVPCYKLGHLLPECINSILSQTFSDFEILIMDDCSPDNTPAVVASFRDERVKHIRNNSNLGHLRNYNKGIEMAQGKYVWLISADDCLRRPYILQKYVAEMESNPRVGYAFCPGVGIRKERETGVLAYSVYRNRDCVVSGHILLRRLLRTNIVLAASALVRRACYEKLGAFPLHAEWAGSPVDFGWNGDWYLWCLFALFYDVAFFAEPMVCYRDHDLALTTFYTHEQNVNTCLAADIGMLWLVRQKAIEAGLHKISRQCLAAVADEYVRHVASKEYRHAVSSMSIGEFEDSLCRSVADEPTRAFVRARFMAGMGNRARCRGDLRAARQYYVSSILQNPWAVSSFVKLLLLSFGRWGGYLYRALHSLRGRAPAPSSSPQEY